MFDLAATKFGKLGMVLLVCSLIASCATTGKHDTSVQFAARLHGALDPNERTISFVYLVERDGGRNNQELIDYLTGRFQIISGLRFFDRSETDRILDERNIVFTGLFDEKKLEYIKDFWPSRYIMTGSYTVDAGPLVTVRLKVLDITNSELVMADTITLPPPEHLLDSLSRTDTGVKPLSAREKLELKKKGLDLYGSRQYIDAIEYLSQYDALYPDDFDVVYGLGDSYRSVGDRTETLRYGLKCIELRPELADSYFLTASAYSWQDPAKAIDYLNRGLTLRPAEHWRVWELACQYERMGNKNSAVEYLRKAIELAAANNDTDALSAFKSDLVKWGGN